MTKWKKTCAKNQESLIIRFDNLEKNLNALQIQSNTSLSSAKEMAHYKELSNHLDNFIQEKEPLIISLLSSPYENLRSLHANLRNLANSNYQIHDMAAFNIANLKLKIQSQDELHQFMLEHLTEVSNLQNAFVKTKINNAGILIALRNAYVILQNQLKIQFNPEIKKKFEDSIHSLKNDFSYLLNPSFLPAAYEASLKEVSRRTFFFSIFQAQYQLLKELVDQERKDRKAFLSEYGKILPVEFIPQLKNVGPTLKVDNMSADSELPLINDPSFIPEFQVNFEKFLTAKNINQHVLENSMHHADLLQHEKRILASKLEEIER